MYGNRLGTESLSKYNNKVYILSKRFINSVKLVLSEGHSKQFTP